MDQGTLFKRLVIGSALLVGSMVVVGATSESGDRPAPRPAVAGSSYSHELLQRDAEMTQRMSVPAAGGAAMPSGQPADDQLVHAQDAGFVSGLEQHQGDIDRMLARPSR